MSTIVTGPGIYDLSEADYHGDTALAPELGRSLSVSGAKKLLAPSCPARFFHEREHGQAPKATFDFGHAAHTLILGKGDEIDCILADDWRTTAAKTARDEARAAGKTPILRDDYAKAEAMADAVKAHPIAAAILSDGLPERSIYWLDEDTGVTLRGRVDWLRHNAIVDYKTTTAGGASPEAFSRTAVNYGYHMQAAWYTDGVAAQGLGTLPFLFIVQEKEAPYLVTVLQLDDEAMRIGRDLNTQAVAVYAGCESSGEWPGYSTDIEPVALPSWYARAHQGVML